MRPAGNTPGKLWGLLEVMREFQLVEYALLLRKLCDAASHFEHLASDKTVRSLLSQNAAERVEQAYEVVSADTYDAVLTLFRETKEFAATHALHDCHNTMLPILQFMEIRNGRVTVLELSAEARHARDALELSAYLPKFLLVPKDRATYVNCDALFGTDVHAAFPSARADTREAGNCLAADCNTAAVFHLMRAVEWAMRALCIHLGFKQLRVRRKGGKVSYQPVAFSEWERILDGLHDAVSSKMQNTKRGTKKQLDQEFYYPVLQDLRGFRDAWRNHVMHTRREYSAKDADAIFDHVKRFMTGLATRVREA